MKLYTYTYQVPSAAEVQSRRALREVPFTAWPTLLSYRPGLCSRAQLGGLASSQTAHT